MIHRKTLKFNHNGTNFEATVTYSDTPFRSVFCAGEKPYYNILLHKPENLSCGGEEKKIRGWSSAMVLKAQGEYHYKYDEKQGNKKETEINIYPIAVEKILYHYYNKGRIAHYQKKVKIFNETVDRKYASDLQKLKDKRLILRRKMKAGEIDSKEYQNLYTPVRKRMGIIQTAISILKSDHEQRYFECCELRERYRVTCPCDDSEEGSPIQ